MKKIYLTVFSLVAACVVQAQSYSLADLESAFLTNNYALIAQKFNIQRADAEIIQEKVWSNPTFSINEVNIWNNKTAETLPNLFGNYGKHQQLALELEQLIETAGKRKHRVALRKLEKNGELLDYEELIRELKKELRQTFNSLGQQEQVSQQLHAISENFQLLHEQYKRQAKANNVALADVYRVQAELIALQKEVIANDAEKRASLQQLMALTQIQDLKVEQLTFPPIAKELSKKVPLTLLTTGLEGNLGIQKQANELAMANQELLLEKSNRKPDLTFSLNYDRGGNIMQDFVGAGVSFDIPVFNRNKGKIKAVGFQIEQESYKLKSTQFDVEQNVKRLQQQLQAYEGSLAQWDSYHFDEYAAIAENYRKNLQEKRVSLIEFVDFIKAFRESQQMYVELVADYLNTYEELQYVVGKDF